MAAPGAARIDGAPERDGTSAAPLARPADWRSALRKIQPSQRSGTQTLAQAGGRAYLIY